MVNIVHLLVFLPAICYGSTPAPYFEFGNHNYDSLEQVLYEAHRSCPHITRLYNLKRPSVQNRNLTVIEFSKHPGEHLPGTPEFKYVGNMHGNEVVGREVLLALIADMCTKYNNGDPRTTWVVDNTRIHILVSMNPDGWEKANNETRDENGQKNWLIGRANAHDVDLNRNFPKLNQKAYHNEEIGGKNNHLESFEEAIHTRGLEPETKAVMMWLNEIPFVLSSNIHGGDLVANYPYDATRDQSPHRYTSSPDDATFRYLAESYSLKHTLMAKEDRTPCDMSGGDLFNLGITNGADWYSVPGGMQDYNLLETNCFEITLEIGCDKFPLPEEEEDYWHQNKEALYNFMEQVHIGVKGMVVDSLTGEPIQNAAIKVYNLTKPVPDNEDPDSVQYINHDITSSKGGDYYRLLIDGKYKLKAVKKGYMPKDVYVEVKNVPLQEAVVMNFDLEPENKPDENNNMIDDRLYAEYAQEEYDNRLRELLHQYLRQGYR